MNQKFSLDRKTFMTRLGTAGLGLGVIVATVGSAPHALAQEVVAPALIQDEQSRGDGEVRDHVRSGEMRAELYAQFTVALADELGVGNSDEVDAAIRVAMMTVVDARVGDGILTFGQGEAIKTLIATSDVPLGPGPMFGPPPGAFMRGVHGPGGEGRLFPIRGENWDSHVEDSSRADNGNDPGAQSNQNANEDSGTNQDNTDSASS